MRNKELQKNIPDKIFRQEMIDERADKPSWSEDPLTSAVMYDMVSHMKRMQPKRYSPTSSKIMHSTGFDCEDPDGLNNGKGISVPVIIQKREKLLGLGASSAAVQINMTSEICQTGPIGQQVGSLEEKEMSQPKKAPVQIEDGGKPTIDQFHEINLGIEEE